MLTGPDTQQPSSFRGDVGVTRDSITGQKNIILPLWFQQGQTWGTLGGEHSLDEKLLFMKEELMISFFFPVVMRFHPDERVSSASSSAQSSLC